MPPALGLSDITTLIEPSLGLPAVGKAALDAGPELMQRLRDARDLLGDPERTLVRLVTSAERVVVGETRRTATYLSLFGYEIDAAIANRIDPRLDPVAPWGLEQGEQLQRLRDDLAPVPLLELSRLDRPAVGLDAMSELGRMLHGAEDPTGRIGTGSPMRFCGEQGERLHLALPGVQRGEVEVGRVGGDLHVRLGPYRRVIALPDSLRAAPVRTAGLEAGELVVTFQWEQN